MSSSPNYDATGRRKTSTARVRLVPGSGQRMVNGRPIQEYFPRPTHVTAVEEAFQAVNLAENYDMIAHVNGGGMTGQAGAIRLGIARALVLSDESLRKTLRLSGLLTRDAREKERKKYGLAGARKRFQFSKR
ncbi:MAG: 30S ribosomal protein S9 [Gemmatimonadetes bacterium]|nr:30S ribosomal protein S9 [Gemmatimonadota bacterium]